MNLIYLKINIQSIDYYLIQELDLQDLSPLILLANCTSFGIIVTLFAWIAAKLVSSNRPTKYDSEASCKARTADDWNLRSPLNSEAISLTSLWKGSFLMRSSVDFQNFLISLRATVPGLNLWTFLTPPACTVVFLTYLLAMCFLGALPLTCFLAVCLVLAIWN